jgi:hypothetical protein
VSRLPPDFVAWMAQPENVEGYQVRAHWIGSALFKPLLDFTEHNRYT